VSPKHHFVSLRPLELRPWSQGLHHWCMCIFIYISVNGSQWQTDVCNIVLHHVNSWMWLWLGSSEV